MDEIEQLREATRLAHEAMKDMKALIREAKTMEAALHEAVSTDVQEIIEACVAAGLASYAETIKDSTAKATEAVFERFDKIGEMLMGESKQQRRRYGESIPELAEKIAEQRRLMS